MSDLARLSGERVAVALSGGVDSAVAAALLLEAGANVVALTMRLGIEADEVTVASAARVAAKLGIAHEVVDLSAAFSEHVVSPFVRGYAGGTTPNPCVACNEHLKFGALLDWCTHHGAETLASGHYVRLLAKPSGGPWLARGLDRTRDQSYFLYRVHRAALARACFPLGAYAKSDVRDLASRLGLAALGAGESRETCFANDDYAALVLEHSLGTVRPGEIVDSRGAVLGTHRGVHTFTVGQRKGLGLPGGPWFVAAIDAAAGRVTVTRRDELLVDRIECVEAVWRLPVADADVTVQLRYNGAAIPALVRCDGDRLQVHTAHAVERPAPGQSVVCYKDDRVVGGGIVATAESAR